MALATQCPHCQTRFRVASDQLKLRGGIVRCGACQRIFDGSAHLIDLEAARPASPDTPPETPPVAEAPLPSPESAPPSQEEPRVDFASQPVYTLDFDSSFDPLGILPKTEPDVQEAAAQDPEPPHGDVLAHAVAASGALVVDVDLPPPDEEPAVAQAQDPEPPHGDVLAHAVDALGFAPPHRLEPELPPAVAFTPPGRIEPSFDLPVDEALVALPLPDDDESEPAAPAALSDTTADKPADKAPDSPARPPPPADGDAPPPALPLRASAAAGPLDAALVPAAAPPARSARAKALDARARRTKLTPTRIDAPKLRVPETDEPEFVRRSRKQEQSGRTRRILMIAGAVVLLLVLAAQLVLNFRNVLAARYPGARPALGSACALLGCRVELPTQIDNLAIENGELTTLGPDTYSLNTLLRNQGSLVQAWPSIELELTDANDKPVLRRVFTPGEYLAQGTAVAAGFGARSEQPVKLHFALADLKPSGYHIFIFYP